MKQTAVEWLEDKIQSDMTFMEILGLINQAKAIEKEQIIEAYLKGYLEEIPNPSASHYYEDMAEKYYNETYESNTKIQST